MQLYEKIISPSNRVTYKLYQPEINNRELSDGEVLTLAGALGITMLMNYSQLVPEHKRVARKVKAVEDSISDLFRGTGQPIDKAMSDYVINCWNLAMQTMARGAK